LIKIPTGEGFGIESYRYEDFFLKTSSLLNPVPELIGCTTFVQIPFLISTGGLL
jgi:hypothetical protein